MFIWDTGKAIVNFEKHGIAFEEAATVFADPEGLELDDPGHSKIEKRFKRLGTSVLGRVLLVVFTIRVLANGNETIRIISARQASRKERKAYSG